MAVIPAELPKTMKALVVKSTSEPPTIEQVPTPTPTTGTAVVAIHAANVISYTRDIYNGKRNYPYPMPLIPGSSAIGRVAALGPDATKLKPGDLVFMDITIRSRDDPSDVFLSAIHHGFTAGSQHLMENIYRDGAYAEYCLMPIENLILMDEKRLLGDPSQGGLGYKIEELAYVSSLLVPYGGLKDINLQAGQTVIVAPATGPFGGAAVLVALAMGARVIAMGRNKTSLANLKSKVPHPERVETVPITGDMAADCEALKKFGSIQAYYDIGPPEAHASTHIKSCILALSHGGRVSLMGGYGGDVAIPHSAIMHKNLRLYGKWMFERDDIGSLFRLIESGMLKLGEAAGQRVKGLYNLEKYEDAFNTAAEANGFGEQVLIKP